MRTQLFSISRSADEVLSRHQRRILGDLDDAYDWESLDPARYPPELVARARVGWTENAFNEYCTAAALAEM